MQKNLIHKEGKIKANALRLANFSFLFLVFIFLISFSSADMKVGLDGSLNEIGINFDRTPFNISEQHVNMSNFWNTLDHGPLRNVAEIQSSWLTNDLFVERTGDTMTGDLIYNSASIGVNQFLINSTNPISLSSFRTETDVGAFAALVSIGSQFPGANVAANDSGIIAGGGRLIFVNNGEEDIAFAHVTGGGSNFSNATFSFRLDAEGNALLSGDLFLEDNQKSIRTVPINGGSSIVIDSNDTIIAGGFPVVEVARGATGNRVVTRWSQNGRNNSFSGAMNTFGNVPASWVNFTGITDEEGINFLLDRSDYINYCDYLQDNLSLVKEGCKYFADTSGRLVPLLFGGDLEVHRSAVIHEGASIFGDFDFTTREGNEFDIQGGDGHIRREQKILSNVTFINQFICDFNVDLCAFENTGTPVDPVNQWNSKASILCPASAPSDEDCAGSAGSLRVMEFSEGSQFSNYTNITFWYTTAFSGSGSEMSIELDDNQGNTTTVFSQTVGLADQFDSFVFPATYLNKDNVTMRIYCDAKNDLNGCYVDDVRVFATFSEPILINATEQQGKWIFGEADVLDECSVNVFYEIIENSTQVQKIMEIGCVGTETRFLGNTSFVDTTIENQTIIGNSNITGNLNVGGTITEGGELLEDKYFLVNGSSQMQGNANIGGFDLTNVNAVNGTSGSLNIYGNLYQCDDDDCNTGNPGIDMEGGVLYANTLAGWNTANVHVDDNLKVTGHTNATGYDATYDEVNMDRMSSVFRDNISIESDIEMNFDVEAYIPSFNTHWITAYLKYPWGEVTQRTLQFGVKFDNESDLANVFLWAIDNESISLYPTATEGDLGREHPEQRWRDIWMDGELKIGQYLSDSSIFITEDTIKFFDSNNQKFAMDYVTASNTTEFTGDITFKDDVNFTGQIFSSSPVDFREGIRISNDSTESYYSIITDRNMTHTNGVFQFYNDYNFTGNLYGDGSQLTGITQLWENVSGVATYDGNVNVSGNITAGGFTVANSDDKVIFDIMEAKSDSDITTRYSTGDFFYEYAGQPQLSFGNGGLQFYSDINVKDNDLNNVKDIDARNITATGNVTADTYFGDGSQLTNLPETNLTGYAKYEFTNNNFNGSGNFTTSGDINVGKTIIDVDSTEALLVRANGDAGDVMVVDTVNGRFGINAVPQATTSDIYIKGRDEVGRQGQTIAIKSGKGSGGFIPAATAWGGGSLNMFGGDGAAANEIGITRGGLGGIYNMVSGNGGDASAKESSIADYTGGQAGSFIINGGDGGDASTGSSTVTGIITGGRGADVEIIAGSGGGVSDGFGGSAISYIGGDGGDILLTAGQGGTSITTDDGNGGDIIFKSGIPAFSGDSGDIQFIISHRQGQGTTTVATFLSDASGMQMDDNIKAIFGSAEDFTIKHTGSFAELFNTVGDIVINNSLGSGDTVIVGNANVTGNITAEVVSWGGGYITSNATCNYLRYDSSHNLKESDCT